MRKTLLISICIIVISLVETHSVSSADPINFIATELLGRPTDKSITVNAIADKDLDIFFEYGREAGNYTLQTDTTFFSTGKSIEMCMEQLIPGTHYYYRMRYRQPGETEFIAGEEHRFHTQRPRGSTFKFAIQADSHIYDKKCTPALYRLTLQNKLADEPDFMLDLGDTFGDDHDTTLSRDEIFQLYLNQRPYFDTVCHSVPLFLCLGNHELEYSLFMNGTAENIAVYATQARQFYYLNPYPDDFYSGNTTVEDFVGQPENYYAWEWGDALFVVLDAYRNLTTELKPRGWDWTIGEQQYHWFRQTLEESQAKYKFVFIHHILGQTRGAVAWADKFEWGGHDQKGNWEFDIERPGWAKPIHQLMVENGVTILFQGHDHLFAKEDLDGIVYQECPMPSDATYDVGAENEGDYPSGIIHKNSGHLRVTVAATGVTVDYIRAWLPRDETAEHRNGEVAYSYTITDLNSNVSEIRTAKEVELNQNFPNPFNPKTHISFRLAKNDRVTLRIYNSVGQMIKTILNNNLNMGEYTVEWDGLNHLGNPASTGIYFYQLQIGDRSQTNKMTLLR